MSLTARAVNDRLRRAGLLAKYTGLDLDITTRVVTRAKGAEP